MKKRATTVLMKTVKLILRVPLDHIIKIKNSQVKLLSLIACLSVFYAMETAAQVNTVEFGKNRVQYQKFSWKYYQTDNFNTYFSQDGLGLGKYVAQVAELELNSIEEFVEYGSQRRINIVAVSYTHLRAHETVLDLVCRLLLEKKKYSESIDSYTN